MSCLVRTLYTKQVDIHLCRKKDRQTRRLCRQTATPVAAIENPRKNLAREREGFRRVSLFEPEIVQSLPSCSSNERRKKEEKETGQKKIGETSS